MTSRKSTWTRWTPTVFCCLAATAATMAQSGTARPASADLLAPEFSSFTLLSDEPPPPATRTAVEDAPAADEETASIFSFNITYTLVSDYVTRGANMSEYPREGREKPNHQVTTTMDTDLGPLFGLQPGSLGTFSFGTFFTWYAAQIKIDPDQGGQNVQEIDYNLAWSFELAPIATTLTLGYNFISMPNAKADNTAEWTIGLDHNDAWAWKWLWPDNEDGVLNPSILFVNDFDLGKNGSWIDLGVSHDFPVFERFTITPSLVLAVDHRYLDPIMGTGLDGSTRLAYVQYGITASYDLTPLLYAPQWAGTVLISGFLYYNDVVGTAQSDGTIEDVLFGGMSLSWSF